MVKFYCFAVFNKGVLMGPAKLYTRPDKFLKAERAYRLRIALIHLS